MGLTQIDESSVAWLKKFSSFVRLARVTAYMFRFINALKGERFQPQTPLSSQEWTNALEKLARATQMVYFASVFDSIADGSLIPRPISRLRPYVTSSRLLKVGGRLQNSLLSQSARHPILLPRFSHLSRLIVRHYHLC
jgi:hypothetical protein